VAIAGVPYPGEAISGDDAICLETDSGFLAALCDGLGHGPEAREASKRAVDAIAKNKDLGLRWALELLKRGLLVNPNEKFYISIAHTDADVEQTLGIVDQAFATLKGSPASP